MPHISDQQLSDAIQNWLFNNFAGAERAAKYIIRDTYKADHNFDPGATYARLDRVTRAIADNLKDYRDQVPLLTALKNAVDVIHADETQIRRQFQTAEQQLQPFLGYQITDQQLIAAIQNWLFDFSAHANDPGYKKRAEEAARNLLCQTYILDHDRDSGTTFARMDHLIREVAATPNLIANIADLTRILVHMHAAVNILDYQAVQDNNGMPTITCLPPNSPPHLEAMVTEMVYECRELERRDKAVLQDSYMEVQQHLTQLLQKEANDRNIAVHELDRNEEIIGNIYALLDKVNSEYQQNLQFLITHYNNQINTNTALLAEFDRNNARAMAEYQREYDKALAAYLAEQKEAKRTAKRKKRQGTFKCVVGIVAGAFVAPFAPMLASQVFVGITGTMAAVAIEGAAFGAVSSLVAGGNVGRSALQGALFAGFGNVIGGALQATRLPMAAMQGTRLHGAVQAAAHAGSVAVLNTVVNGGNALRNIFTAVVTAGVGEYVIPATQSVMSTTASATQQIVRRATDSIKRAVIVGVPVAVVSGKDLAMSLVAAGIGAVQAAASTVAGAVGENVASGMARVQQAAANATKPKSPPKAAPKPKASPKPKPTAGSNNRSELKSGTNNVNAAKRDEDSFLSYPGYKYQPQPDIDNLGYTEQLKYKTGALLGKAAAAANTVLEAVGMAAELDNAVSKGLRGDMRDVERLANGAFNAADQVLQHGVKPIAKAYTAAYAEQIDLSNRQMRRGDMFGAGFNRANANAKVVIDVASVAAGGFGLAKIGSKAYNLARLGSTKTRGAAAVSEVGGRSAATKNGLFFSQQDNPVPAANIKSTRASEYSSSSFNANNVNAQAAINRKLSALEYAQRNAVKTENLPDGRIRYYALERPSHSRGGTRGASYVTEHNPESGQVRSWMECYDHHGNINRIHSKMIDGRPVSAQHYPPTKAEIESWFNKPRGLR